MKLLQFTSHSCGTCMFLIRSKTIPMFVKGKAELDAHVIKIDDKDGYTGTKAEVEAYKLSDVYGVQSLPGLIFVTDSGVVLEELTGAANAVTLEKAFKKAQAAEEKLNKKLSDATPSETETAFATFMKRYGDATQVD